MFGESRNITTSHTLSLEHRANVLVRTRQISLIFLSSDRSSISHFVRCSHVNEILCDYYISTDEHITVLWSDFIFVVLSALCCTKHFVTLINVALKVMKISSHDPVKDIFLNLYSTYSLWKLFSRVFNIQ